MFLALIIHINLCYLALILNLKSWFWKIYEIFFLKDCEIFIVLNIWDEKIKSLIVFCTSFYQLVFYLCILYDFFFLLTVQLYILYLLCKCVQLHVFFFMLIIDFVCWMLLCNCIFFLSSSLMTWNSTLKVNKWNDRGSNPDPLHNNANVHQLS
jgi:hypothetical protein